MELAEADPKYVTDSEPTVPKVITVPCTVPLMLVGASLNPEMVIMPLKSCPDCCQVNLNVPLNEPLYDPDHLPESEM